MANVVALIIYELLHFDDVLHKWHDAGAPSITVLDCVGTRSLEEAQRRGDLPLLPRIRDLLQSEGAPRKLVFSIVPDELVDRLIEVTQEVMGDMTEPKNGILFVVPLARVIGLRTPTPPGGEDSS